MFKNVKQIHNKTEQTHKDRVVTKRKLHIFSLLFLCIVTSGLLGFSISDTNLAKEVKNITSSWAPNITDLGKLKFVNKHEEEEVFANVENMNMPFDNTYVTESDNGFLVNGLGGLVVKSCLEGKVTKIEVGEQKTVHISHGKGLMSIYGNIDTVGVKEGDKVDKNTPIGVSQSSVINFKILYKNKTLAGLSVKDGEMVFL